MIEWSRNVFPIAWTIAMGHQSIKRLVDPDDIAELAVFLASDAAKSISGQTQAIDADMQRN
jgi:NAD(P)-dependent dehydrogenase (short-subunit alcohol dehydrogenase family)